MTNEERQLQLERLWLIEAELVRSAMSTQIALKGVRDQLRELQCVATEEPAPAKEPATPTNLSFVESGRSAVGCSGCDSCQGAGKCADCGDIV